MVKTRRDKNWINIISIVFLLFLVLLAINQFFEIQIIKNYLGAVIILATISGILIINYNKENSEKEFLDEKEIEDINENKRELRFSREYPKITRIPIVNNIIRRAYKEGLFYSTSLTIIIIVQLIISIKYLRMTNLWPDEALQYFVVQGIRKTGYPNTFGNVLYLRGTVMSYAQFAMSLLLKNAPEYYLRLVSVFSTICSTFLVYSLIKITSNKKAALLGTIIFSSSLWILILSFYGRPYMLYILISLISVYLMMLFRDKKTQRKNILYGLITLMIIASLSSEMSIFLAFSILTFTLFNLRIIIKEKNTLLKTKMILLIILGGAIFLSTIIIPNVIPLTFEKNKLVGFSGESSAKLGFVQLVINHLTLNKFYINLLIKYYPVLLVFILLSASILLYKVKYNPIVWPINYILVTLLLASLTDFKSKEAIIGLILPFVLIVAVYFSNRLLNGKIKKSLLSTILILVVLIPTASYFMNYQFGHKLSYPEGISPTFSILPDFKNPSLFAKNYLENHKNVTLITSYGITLIHSYYLEREPDYILGGDLTLFVKEDEKNYSESYTLLHSIRTANELKEIIKNEKNLGNNVLIVTSFTSYDYLKNLRSGRDISHNPKDIIKILKENENKVVYVGEDNISKVYLF